MTTGWWWALWPTGLKRFVHNIPAARRLRRPQTPTGEALWDRLRDRRFLGLKFRRQHAVYNFVVDFYCVEMRLAIEVDGTIHDDPGQQGKDAERQSRLESLGVRFIRVRADDVSVGIDEVMSCLAASLSPSTAQSGEGVGG